MKSIFKKIAFVLALAMVVTMMPTKAAAAAESDGPQMYSTLKLYLGGDVTETYAGQRYAKVWNKDGYDVEFESSDTSVATVNSKGYVTAKKVGSAVVTATFTDEDGNTVEKECEVTVKKNAVRAGLSSASTKLVTEEGIKVGETVQLTAVRKDADGNTVWSGRDVITDAVRFLSSNTEIFTVQKTTGKITGVAEGEATLYVWGVQSEGKDKETGEYPATTERKEYKVKVVTGNPVVTGATVKSVTKIELDVKGVTKDNVKDLKIMNEFGGDIKTLFKDPVLSEDGKTITLEKYVQLVNDEKLGFAFGEEEAFTLTVKIGEVEKIVLVGPATAVVAGDPTNIDIRFLDANNIELAIPNSGLSFSVDDNTFAYVDQTNRKISIYQVGKSVTLEATYFTGKYDENWNAIELKSNKITVTGVDATVATAKEIQFNREDKDYSATNPITIYTDSVGERLHAKVILSTENSFVTTNQAPSAFSFETLDPSVLLVDAATGTLVPVKAGTARILVKFDNGSAKINGVATVRVLDKTNLTGVVANQQSVAISNANDVETATIEFTGKDQYGQDKAIENLQVERLTSPNNVDAAHWTIDGNKLTFKGCDQTPGTYTYRVFADNAKKVSTVVSVIVKKPTVPMTDGAPDISKAASYRIVPMSGNVELDPSKADSNAEYKFRIVAQDGAGVAFAVVKDNGVINELAVKFGNDTFKAFDDTDRDADGIYTVNFAVTGSGITVSGGAISLAEGSGDNVFMKRTSYAVKEGDFVITGKYSSRVLIPLTGKTAVKKTAPSVSVESAVVQTASGAAADVEVAILAKLKVNDDAKYTILGFGEALNKNLGKGTSYVLVKSVKVAEKLDNGNYIVHTVNLNQYFSVTVTQ